MRVLLASAAIGAALSVIPAAAGNAPAWSQDFSITNPQQPADGSRRDLIRQLQAWWDVHSYYPNRASLHDESGTVGVRIVILGDGRIFSAQMLTSSGSPALDEAAPKAFAGGYVQPLPPGAPETQLNIMVHYVLARRHDQPVPAGYKAEPPKAPFTITNDPVTPPILAKMLLKTCTGTIVLNALRNHPSRGIFYDSKLIFYREADGSPWVKFYEVSRVSYSPVLQVGNLVSWTGPALGKAGDGRSPERKLNHYTAWLDSNNKLDGCISSDDTWQIGAGCDNAPGTLVYSCAADAAPQPQSNAWDSVPGSPTWDSP
jgi:TonB family protein